MHKDKLTSARTKLIAAEMGITRAKKEYADNPLASEHLARCENAINTAIVMVNRAIKVA